MGADAAEQQSPVEAGLKRIRLYAWPLWECVCSAVCEVRAPAVRYRRLNAAARLLEAHLVITEEKIHEETLCLSTSLIASC